METEEPDFDLLPQRAADFFGLRAPIDRMALKRAYMTLVRRYKPERHPEEFKRIRAAFEELDERLRYGEDAAESGFAPQPSVTPSAASIVEVPRFDVAALLNELGARATRDRVRDEVTRDPSLWCALALIEDALEEKPLAAVHRLIEGLRVAGGRADIVQLLAVFLREDLEPKQAADLLVRLAEATAKPGRAGGLPPHLYWFLTDHHWTRLATSVRFDGLRALLERCRREVGERGNVSAWVLLLKLRRRAAFRADEEWLTATDAELAQNVGYLPPWAVDEYDLVLWLDRYREVREQFKGGHPFRAELDRALVELISGDEVRGEREFLASQIACLERRDELLEALPWRETPSDQDEVAFEVLSWYGEERMPSDPSTQRRDMERSVEFARRLDRRASRSLIGYTVRFITHTFGLTGMLVAIGVGVGLKPWIGDAASIVMLIGVIAVIAGMYRGWFAPLLRALTRPLMERLYRKKLRATIAEFLAESRLPAEVVVHGLGVEDHLMADWAHRHAATDSGLRFYSLAVRSID